MTGVSHRDPGGCCPYEQYWGYNRLYCPHVDTVGVQYKFAYLGCKHGFTAGVRWKYISSSSCCCYNIYLCVIANKYSTTLEPYPSLFLHYQSVKSTIMISAVLPFLTLALSTGVHSSIVFSLSTLPNGQGERKSWVVDRWKCRE
jgi:hypothetical protein